MNTSVAGRYYLTVIGQMGPRASKITQATSTGPHALVKGHRTSFTVTFTVLEMLGRLLGREDIGALNSVLDPQAAVAMGQEEVSRVGVGARLLF